MKYIDYEELDNNGNVIETHYSSGTTETEVSKGLNKAFIEYCIENVLPIASIICITLLIYVLCMVYFF